MTHSTLSSKGCYFSDDKGNAAFNAAFSRRLVELQKTIVSQYLNPENTFRLRHGSDWRHPGTPEAITGGIQEHSAYAETPFQELIDNDLGQIDRTAAKLAEAMHKNFATMMYSTLSAACEQTGNTVDARAEGSLADAFFATIEKIEFVADRYGNVNLPEIHTSPETGKKMAAAMEAISPEFEERFEQLKARKIKEALEREAARKAKFLCYGDNP
jgi:hypothetical protein